MNTDDFDIDALPNPEDYEAEMGQYALVGLYMRVYFAFVKVSSNFTKVIKESYQHGELSTGLAKHISNHESKYEQWLARADEQLPEWFDHKLLGYPDESES